MKSSQHKTSRPLHSRESHMQFITLTTSMKHLITPICTLFWAHHKKGIQVVVSCLSSFPPLFYRIIQSLVMHHGPRLYVLCYNRTFDIGIFGFRKVLTSRSIDKTLLRREKATIVTSTRWFVKRMPLRETLSDQPKLDPTLLHRHIGYNHY
jgi:hypothetical protein